MHSKPFGLFPSRTHAIRAMRRRGMNEREIAAELGIKPNTVTSLEARDRRRQREQRVTRLRTVALPGDAFVDLHAEAQRRGVTVHGLARAILAAIAEDNLFAAVLDA